GIGDGHVTGLQTCAVPISVVPAGAISIGASAKDTASLVGATADASGSVHYFLFSNNDCTGQLADLTPTTNTFVNGAVPDSQSHRSEERRAGYYWGVQCGAE